MRYAQWIQFHVGVLFASSLLIASSAALAQSGAGSTQSRHEHADPGFDFRSEIVIVRDDGTIVTPTTLAERRPCDDSKSTYTMDEGTGQGTGEGDDIDEAMLSAVWDAVLKEAYSQFSCEKCDDGKACPKSYSVIDPGSAVVSNPTQDCSYDWDKAKWVCTGEVNFQLGDGPDPEVKAGCKKCEE